VFRKHIPVHTTFCKRTDYAEVVLDCFLFGCYAFDIHYFFFLYEKKGSDKSKINANYLFDNISLMRIASPLWHISIFQYCSGKRRFSDNRQFRQSRRICGVLVRRISFCVLFCFQSEVMEAVFINDSRYYPCSSSRAFRFASRHYQYNCRMFGCFLLQNKDGRQMETGNRNRPAIRFVIGLILPEKRFRQWAFIDMALHVGDDKR
jgi:hypothetical protein